MNGIKSASSRPATADVYRKLFYHVGTLTKSFLCRLSGISTTFQLLQVNALELAEHLEEGRYYSRIEV